MSCYICGNHGDGDDLINLAIGDLSESIPVCKTCISDYERIEKIVEYTESELKRIRRELVIYTAIKELSMTINHYREKANQVNREKGKSTSRK